MANIPLIPKIAGCPHAPSLFDVDDPNESEDPVGSVVEVYPRGLTVATTTKVKNVQGETTDAD